MRFDVELTQIYTELISVVVDAKDESDAEQKALQYAEAHPQQPKSKPEFVVQLITPKDGQ